MISIPNTQHPILHNSIKIELLTNNKLISNRNDIYNHRSVLEWMTLSHGRYNSTIRNDPHILLVGELQGGRRARRSEIKCNPFYQLQRSRSTGAARVIQGNFCAPPTHVLGNLLRSTTQTLKGVWNPYTKAVKGLSVINAGSLKILFESCRYGWPSKRCDTHFLCFEELKSFSLRRGTPNVPHAAI